MLQLMKQDVVLFPFSDKNLNGDLGFELVRTRAYGFTCMDGDEFTHTKSRKFKEAAQLVVIAHGSGEAPWSGTMKSDEAATLSAAGLAAMVANSGFVKGFSNEIYIWSCMSGAVGGFATQFAKALVPYGVAKVSGIAPVKIYGCLRNTAPISKKGELMVQGDDGKARPATLADMRVFVGVNL